MKGPRPKSSTEYVREFRERMRQEGFVKKDVWILPEHAQELSAVERRLRLPGGADTRGTEGAATAWTARSLQAALAESRPVRAGYVSLELLEGVQPSLHLVMHEHGDLPVFVAVSGEQIIVESLMWPVADVLDTAAFNAHVLRTHKVLPLSNMAVETIGGVACYIMYGALDTHSSLANVIFEIETLAENVLNAAEAYAPFLREELLEGVA
ncbi:YjfI family protein [Lysobacter auxotrophicus]|uniref:YjfI family protein n=1 Tax=Lysobacter auxotrophicus TaxID=2992573 RepID=A0ABM8D9E6_9GAMM|nr:YjfI family protein [Lysobacter auxotrophicus]BDU15175.1 YjfI family protein [Lysobacter auxotrophicus]